MNKVVISAEEVPLPAWKKDVRSFVVKTLAILGHNNWEVSIVFCSDSFIRALNKKWRGIDTATDILSFPLGEPIKENGKEYYAAGDIIISLETLPENAAYFGLSEDEELRRLLTHGILHLAGYDHTIHTIDEEAIAAEPMFALQESILAALKKEIILC